MTSKTDTNGWMSARFPFPTEQPLRFKQWLRRYPQERRLGWLTRPMGSRPFFHFCVSRRWVQVQGAEIGRVAPQIRSSSVRA